MPIFSVRIGCDSANENNCYPGGLWTHIYILLVNVHNPLTAIIFSIPGR
jgi:hypothetical protein